MMFIDTITPQGATGAVRDMYERQQRAFGYVPNYARIFCHRPEVMAAWAGLLSSIRRNVDDRRFELVTLAAAHTLNNSYCSLAHGRALAKIVGEQAVVHLAHGRTSDGCMSSLTEAEQATVAFARQVARDASAVTSDDAAVLRHLGLTDAEIFDIVAIAAARSFFTRMLDGLGACPDSDYLRMNDALRRALTVGRPIGTDELERLPAIGRTAM
jgi:uncharacterized peroxidase-related enzyme